MNYSGSARRLAGKLRPRLLSIRGSQGGPSDTPPAKCPAPSTLPLQLLGFEVDPINAGQLMNRNSVRQQQEKKQQRQQRHSNRRRPTLEDDQVDEGRQRSPFDELAKSGQAYSHIINGYIGSRQLLIQLALLVRRLKRANPTLQFVCDPVMGDHGPGLYVPADLVPIYQEQVMSVINRSETF
jgi:pyridoxine kinase